MLGVHQPHLKVVFQDVVYRLPVNTGALDGHMGAAPLRQPCRQGFQIGGHGTEAPLLRVKAALGVDVPPADHQELLVHIDAGTVLENGLHTPPPCVNVGRSTPAGYRWEKESLLCVLSVAGCDN